jgi:hypothetical protein
MNGNLQRAINKARPFPRLSGGWEKPNNPARVEYCGCFTPSEIFALIDAGVEPTETYKSNLPYYKEKLQKGESSGHWFYFYPNGLKMKH